MKKSSKPACKWEKFVARRKKKKRQQKNDNIFTSDFERDHKWAVIIIYEYYMAPLFKKKIIGFNCCITKLKKEAEDIKFIHSYPIKTFDNWDQAKEYFEIYRRNIKGDLLKSADNE